MGAMSGTVSKARSLGRIPGYPRLLGGRLCLDLVNTVEQRWSGAPVDALSGAEVVAQWGFHSGAVSETERDDLALRLRSAPHDGELALARTIELRELAYSTLAAVATTGRPPAQLPTRLEEIIQDTLRRARLRWTGTRMAWTIEEPTIHLVGDRAALDLLDLLTSAALNDVKQCPGCGDCGWLFLDTSKNRTRRWCSMEGCGSRAKMRRHYQRVRHHPVGS